MNQPAAVTTAEAVGKLDQHRSTFLSPEFVTALQSEGRKYRRVEITASKRQWKIGGMVNAEWEQMRDELDGEISREEFLQECSHWLNKSLPFPVVASSGETLRRWADVARSYRDMPGLEAFQDALSFDHFFKARKLANDGKVSFPVLALTKAAENELTADEMVMYFDPPAMPTEYDRFTGWVAGLMSCKYEWLKPTEREQIRRWLADAPDCIKGS